MNLINKNNLLEGYIANELNMNHTKNDIPYLNLLIAIKDFYKDSKTEQYVRRYQKIPVTVWGSTAEYLQEYAVKGHHIIVQFKLKTQEKIVLVDQEEKTLLLPQIIGTAVELIESKEQVHERIKLLEKKKQELLNSDEFEYEELNELILFTDDFYM